MKTRPHRSARLLVPALAFLVALATAPASAQPTPKPAGEPSAPALPNTPSGMCVAAYIAAFNSADPQAVRDFFAAYTAPAALERASVERRVERTRGLQGELQSLQLRQVVEAGEAAVTVLLVARTGDWVELAFQFEPAPPHKLVGIRVDHVEPPGDSAGPSPANDGELAKAIEAYVAGLVQADEFAGVVLVARGDTPIFLRAYGLADRGFGTPNRPDTRFNLGSINKLFTTIAVGQLLEQGKLSLGDTIGRFLPDYPNREAMATVTVKHLLEMTSGIGDFFGERFEATPKDRVRTIRDYLPLFADKPLEFKPGTQTRYSNGGYVVLGVIIEKASGQDYYAYVREHLFKPLGMASTDSYEADASVPNLAMGYTRPGPSEPRRSNIYTRPARGSSAGGGYSTAEDMLRFGLALQRGALLKPETVRAVFGEMWPAAPSKELLEGRISGGWTGGAPGINAALETDARAGTTIVVLANLDPPAAGRVAKKIRPWLERPAR